jgi:hypothetical protein
MIYNTFKKMSSQYSIYGVHVTIYRRIYLIFFGFYQSLAAARGGGGGGTFLNHPSCPSKLNQFSPNENDLVNRVEFLTNSD